MLSEQKRNLESLREKCALCKVPHLKARPLREGKSAAAELCKGILSERTVQENSRLLEPA